MSAPCALNWTASPKASSSCCSIRRTGCNICFGGSVTVNIPALSPISPPNSPGRIEEHYSRCDALLSAVLDKVDENTLLIVLSDHGFGTFRRAFDTNTWLWQNGLLALKDSRKPGEDLGDGFAAVDWSKTYAYAVGLGGIYLNLKGRESGGILEEGSEAERVRKAIQTGLADFPDAQTQRAAIRSVSRREELYSGAFVENSPDLLVNFHRGFRVSWQSAVGGFSNSMLEDNMRRWSGDHIVDPESVPGILFMNRAVRPQSCANHRSGAHDIEIPRGRGAGIHGRRVATLKLAIMTRMKICVLGLDCAAPEVIFGDERLVNLRRLMDLGVYGRLESVVPPITVPAWMCMAPARIQVRSGYMASAIVPTIPTTSLPSQTRLPSRHSRSGTIWRAKARSQSSSECRRTIRRAGLTASASAVFSRRTQSRMTLPIRGRSKRRSTSWWESIPLT